MKKSSERNKKPHGDQPAQNQPRKVPQTKSFLKQWAFVGSFLLLIVAAGGTWAFLELVVWNKIPSELVGKWVVIDGPQEGATFDFYRSGQMIGQVNQGGQLGIVNATIRVEGDTIKSTTKNPRTGGELTVLQHIRTLTPKELVVGRGSARQPFEYAAG